MIKYYFLILVFSIIFSARSQDIYRLTFDNFQQTDNYSGSELTQVKFPNDGFMVVMGGLNDWDGLNNYFNIFGAKLIVDSVYKGKGGIQNIVLRREDGLNFFNLFPTLRVTLTPSSQVVLEDPSGPPAILGR